MNQPLTAFKATFSDWRTVKGRKQLQLIFEVPLEQQGAVLEMLGAPRPSDPAWCGIALLTGAAAQAQGASAPAPTKDKRNWNDLPPATQAGIRCGEAAFQRFISEEMLGGDHVGEIGAKEFIYSWCKVESRAQLSDPLYAPRWADLNSRYEAWMRAA
jgi:hypothetical protein